jgi:hypothetical protein
MGSVCRGATRIFADRFSRRRRGRRLDLVEVDPATDVYSHGRKTRVNVLTAWLPAVPRAQRSNAAV